MVRSAADKVSSMGIMHRSRRSNVIGARCGVDRAQAEAGGSKAIIGDVPRARGS